MEISPKICVSELPLNNVSVQKSKAASIYSQVGTTAPELGREMKKPTIISRVANQKLMKRWTKEGGGIELYKCDLILLALFVLSARHSYLSPIASFLQHMRLRLPQLERSPLLRDARGLCAISGERIRNVEVERG